MMCLASKVRTICGKANSPTLSHRTFRFKELDCQRKTRCCHKARPFSKCHESQLVGEQEDEGFKIPDVPRPGASEEEIEDWAEEVRPSMRKLRQGMDSLLKTTRMMCSVFRLQQSPEAVRLTASVKHRRDICFSQALTSLVSALMSRLWCHPPDPVFLSVLTQIGPLVYFEGLLSMHGEDVTIFNDMIVTIEDLRAVQFQFDFTQNKKKIEQHPTSCTTRPTSLSDESIPLPTVTGSRINLIVHLPAPGWVYRSWNSKNPSFSIIPVFFNIGINEKATIAEKLGKNSHQEMNNLENYNRLAKYVEAFKSLSLDIEDQPIRRGLSNQVQLDELMMKLKKECSLKKNKNVEVFSLCSEICLLLNGQHKANVFPHSKFNALRSSLHELQERQGQDRDVCDLGAS